MSAILEGESAEDYARAREKLSEQMRFLLDHAPAHALLYIAELEADHARIELLDDPGLAPNLRLDADDEGEPCWSLGDEGVCYATVRDALDSITVDDEDSADFDDICSARHESG